MYGMNNIRLGTICFVRVIWNTNGGGGGGALQHGSRSFHYL
jgi:hypothetical protein